MNERVTPEQLELPVSRREFADVLTGSDTEGVAQLRFVFGDSVTMTEKIRNMEFFSYFILNPHTNGQPVEYILNVFEDIESGTVTVEGRDALAQLDSMAGFFLELTDPEHEHYEDRVLYTDKYLVPKIVALYAGNAAINAVQ